MINRIVMVMIASLLICTVNAQKLNTLQIKNEVELSEFFRYTGKDVPIISGHRGSHVKDYPENSIASFQFTLQHTPAFFEIDPRFTKDSVIVLLHDSTLDRTTTGKGRLADYAWSEIKKMKLKDSEGNITDYHIPTLAEAIEWARGKTILNLDKKDVPLEMTAAMIKKHHVGAFVMVTVHNAQQAKFYYDDDSDRMMSAFVKTPKALKEYEDAGIPWKNMIAYIGSENKASNKEMLDLLHARGVMCMISAAPSYDRLTDSSARAIAYRDIFLQGSDILESDLPVEVAVAIQKLLPMSSKKGKYFKRRVSRTQ